MKLTKSKLKQVINEEIDQLKLEGILDFMKKEREPVDFKPDHMTRAIQRRNSGGEEAGLDKEQQKRLNLAMQTTQRFLDQELTDEERMHGFDKLRRLLGSLMNPHTDLDRVIKNVLKEEFQVLGNLDLENNFIKKHKIKENEIEDGMHGLWNSIKDRVKEMDEDMDRAAAEEYEKVEAIDKFLDDAKDFVDGWWSGK
jgi:hypothetical protein